MFKVKIYAAMGKYTLGSFNTEAEAKAFIATLSGQHKDAAFIE